VQAVLRIAPLAAAAVAAAFGACSGDEDGPREGRGAEDTTPPQQERGSIVVPESDPTPPRPVVRLAGSRATLEKGVPRVLLPPDEPFAVTVVGRDPDGGMGRARVAIRARLTCRSTGGEVATRPLVRYVPLPQIVRIRIAPGTRTRTELRRTVTHRFDTRCGGGTLERFRGEAWADVTNASGLDATSKHIRFGSR
jgi:hypothetical protein